MKVCSICHKISGTNNNHLDCVQKRRIELEDQDLKEKLTEKLDLAKNSNELGTEIKAILEHLTKEKKSSD